MKLAILSALAQEQTALLEQLAQAQCVRHGGRDFWCSLLHGQSVVLAVSRIGKVAAATTATALIERFGVHAIAFTGVAGGLKTSPQVRVGDVVVARELLQHDLDASPLFPRYEVPLYGRSRFATDPTLTAALSQAATQVCADNATHFSASVLKRYALHRAQVHSGLIVSGDRFVCSSSESRSLQEALPDALAVEMEGAAVAQVCFDYGLPFCAVRTISDRADDSAHVDFGHFVEDVASHYATLILLRWLQLLR